MVLTALSLALGLAGTPVEASKRPPVPTHDDIQRVWLGVNSYGSPACRLEVHPDGTGVFTVLDVITQGPYSFRITHYRLAAYRINFALEVGESGPEDVYLAGDALGGHLTLTIGSRESDWRETMNLLPLETVLSRVDLLTSGAPSLVGREQE